MKAALQPFRQEKKLLLWVLVELLLAVLVIVSCLDLFGFNLINVIKTKTFVFALSPNPVDYAVFIASLAMLVIVFFAIQKKVPVLYSAQQKAFSEIKLSARQKISNSKADARAPALLLLEFIFVVIVFVSLSAFFDAEFELIPWSKAGIFPPFTTIINAIIAIIVLIAFYWLYSQTSDFRHKAPLKSVKRRKAKKKAKKA